MSKNELEYRSFTGLGAADESADNGSPLKISGYFSVFNSESRNLGGFTEIIEPGAFTETLAEGNDVRALAFHDWNLVLGRTKNDSLKLTADERGLYAEITLPDTQFARDLHKQIKDGYIDSASFGFRIKDREMEEREDGSVVQRIKSIDLHEISIVSNPAYAATEVSARCVEKFKTNLENERKAKEFEKFLVEKLKLEMLLEDDE